MPVYDVAVTIPQIVDDNTGMVLRKEKLIWNSAKPIVALSGEAAKIVAIKTALGEVVESDQENHEEWVLYVRRWGSRSDNATVVSNAPKRKTRNQYEDEDA